MARPQPVAHAAHGLQKLRVSARLLQLAAERLDVHVHRAVADHHVAAPDRVEQLAALEDPPRRLEEGGEQVELGARQRQLGVAERGAAGARLDAQPPGPCSGGSSSCGRSPRNLRSTARTRATTSRGENGFKT